ncbi:MAG: DUF1800 family protein [Bacteroidetes bacterium]|nr:DUF1800 family protein [Bacteroidota bacterium]
MASLNPIQGALGIRRAAHLLRRSSYRYTRQRVDELALLSAQEAVALLLTPSPLQLEQPLFAAGSGTPSTWINPPQGPNPQLPAEDFELKPYVVAWWVHEALHDPGICHKMGLFLHQFLATDTESGSSMAYFDYLSLLHWSSLGNFKKLLIKMVVDNCMLRYLNNDQNYVNNPNENFAREFFELFTIGRGLPAGPDDYTTYTEDDIVQAAKVFTGYNHANRNQNTDLETGLPAGKPYPQSHDFQPKTFSARFGNATITAPSNDEAGMKAELQAFVDLVFAQEATAKNICRRLYHFFVTRNISAEAEADIITGMAEIFVTNNFELKPVLEALLMSAHFYDADDSDPNNEIIGALIKSPLELCLQALSFFNMPIPDPHTENEKHYKIFYGAGIVERLFTRAGMPLFFPFDVAGYSGYYQEPDFNRQFFNSATIIARYKMPEMFLTGTFAWGGGNNQPLGSKLDIASWVRDSGVINTPADASSLVETLANYLFPEQPDSDRIDYFLNKIFLNGLPAADWSYEWENYINTGNDSEVSIPLGKLITAMLYAPEYQVF